MGSVEFDTMINQAEVWADKPSEAANAGKDLYAVHAVSKLGFWSSVLTCLLALGWDISMAIQNIINPPAVWNGLPDYLDTFNSIEMLNLIPSLPLASVFIVLMVSIHFYAPTEKKIWSLLGLSFAIVYAVFASFNYLFQFIVVRPAILSGQTEGLALFVMGNPNSLFWTLANSYTYMSLSMLFAAWVFDRHTSERWIRRIFIVVGLTAPLQLAHTIFGIPLPIGILVILIWMIGVPLSGFLLAIQFLGYPNQIQPQGASHA